ncbi:MAG: hypothetical protein R2911_39340 [Caldilineaceae bacterium]
MNWLETGVNLAPHHKQGFVAPNPVLLAGGVIGNGEAYGRGLNTAALGGVVIGPVMRRSRGGGDAPRMAHINGGMVLETTLQNRGITTLLKRFAPQWEQLGCPVIVQIADSQPHDVQTVVNRLNEALFAGIMVSGMELLLPQRIDADAVRHLIRAARRDAELPLWVKLPLENVAEMAQAAVGAGADGLVVAQPPAGAAWAGDKMVTGALYGPLAFGPMLAALHNVAALQLDCALLACGGIHTPQQAQQALQVGAHAIQLDSAVWVEPGLPELIVDALTNTTADSENNR